MTSFKFSELKNLHNHGLALHWLKPRSKMPVESRWTKGPRLDWDTFKGKYQKGYNVGVRLGEASKVAGAYLAVIDVDVKSDNPKHRKEAEGKLFEIFPEAKNAPYVLSGRGNGSAHYYVRVKTPVSGSERKGQSSEVVKVKMPSTPPSQKEISQLSEAERKAGLRLRPAWEVSLLSEGRQVVLPGSLHPDTGKLYEWGRVLNGNAHAIPEIHSVTGKSSALNGPAHPLPRNLSPRVFKEVNLNSLGLRRDQIEALESGAGVTDRSAYCFSLCMALLARKIPESQIVSLLTDPKYWLSATGYEHAKTKSRERAAQWIEKYCLRKAKEKVNESAFDHEVVEEDSSPDTKPSVFSEMKDWHKELDLQNGPRGAPPTLRATFKNLKLIIENEISPHLLKRDIFSNEDIYAAKTPWGFKPGRKRSGSMDDALHFKQWLIENFELEVSLNLIEEALSSIALQNQFHPVKEFLEGLQWDGVERVPTVFRRYLNAKMPEPYLTAVTRKFFLALIARIYHPGIKFDHVVVFEGKQGIGKSTFSSILVGEKWFLDGLPNLHDKDAALNLQGIWLVEMGELSTLYRSELETAKAFITRQVDKVRPPYGKRREDFARSCVFTGTTNDHEYLMDASGGRRFWSVFVEGCDFDALKRDRLQLLAEAKFLYDFCMEPLFLSGKEKIQATEVQDSRRVEDEGDSMETAFLEWLETPVQERNGPGIDLNKIKMEDLFEGPWAKLKLTMTMSNRKAAGRVLRKMGYQKSVYRKGKFWVKKKEA
jgi:predicted P-loop ATPase